jgi:subtilase family serine protease
MLTSSSFDRNHATMGYMYDFNVTGSSEIWFVDSYLNIDYHSSPTLHNVLYVRDDSLVYAYNMSIDTTYAINDRVGAIRTAGNGVVHIMRWASVLCVDNEGVPIENVALSPILLQTGASPRFPDSGGSTPHIYILTYLGETALTWMDTGADGKALLPLPIERIDDFVNQTTPNSDYDGPYTVTGTYLALTSSQTFSFNPYPAMDPEDGTMEVTLVFDTLLPKPDLRVTDIRWTPPDPEEGENITFEADVWNNGATGANDVYVCFEVDTQPLNNTPTYISFIGAGATVTTPIVPPDLPVYWADATGDNHTVLVVADCLNGVSESDETNNGLAEIMYVVPLLPDYEIIPGYISFPLNSYIGNPVQIDITVANPGRDVAPPNSVKIFIGDPRLGAAQEIGEVPISNITDGSATQTFFLYTFDEAKDYKICVEVDFDDAVREESEDNNIACNILRVDLAPNLVVTTNDIGVGDPCTRWGQTVTPQAVVRNIGYVDATAFTVDFLVDGNPFASGNSAGIPANSSEVISASIPWSATSPGIHVLSVVVDLADAVKESTKADNQANKEILVFHNKMAAPTYSGTHTLPVDTTFEGNVDITGSLTIDGKTARIKQDDPLTGRYCIKVMGTGSLILTNGAMLTSNYPLVIYVTDSASLVVEDSDFELDVRGVGGLFADASAVIHVETSIMGGNIFSTGYNVSLMGVDLLGTDLYIETAETSHIWDTEFTGVTDVFLLSDDGDVNTVDFDIRNVTSFLEPNLDAQLVFKGQQLAELTNVPTYVPEGDEWWMGMVTENAKVSMFWWLTVKMVDGTGAVLTSLTPEMNLDTLDLATLLWVPVPSYTGISVPGGQIVLRVLSEEMHHYPVWGWTNSTYAIDARVRVPPVTGDWFYPDTHEAQGNWTGDVRANTEVELRFSGLTPDFSISMISFIGDGSGINQPVNRPLQIQATVFNSGNIASSNVEVMMFLASEWIGYNVTDVPAAGSAAAMDDEWMPTSIGTKIILICVDFNNTIPEIDETNNCLVAGLNVLGWPDLSVVTAEILFDTEPVEGVPGDMTATIRNVGTNNALNVQVMFQDDDGWLAVYDIPNIAVGGSEDATVQWTPSSAGTHALTVQVNASGGDISQTDFELYNNIANRTVFVLTLPDLQVEIVSGSGWSVADEITQGTDYSIYVKVNNTGGSTARNFTVVLVLDDTDLVGQAIVNNVTAGGFVELIIGGLPISDIGPHQIVEGRQSKAARS